MYTFKYIYVLNNIGHVQHMHICTLLNMCTASHIYTICMIYIHTINIRVCTRYTYMQTLFMRTIKMLCFISPVIRIHLRAIFYNNGCDIPFCHATLLNASCLFCAAAHQLLCALLHMRTTERSLRFGHQRCHRPSRCTYTSHTRITYISSPHFSTQVQVSMQNTSTCSQVRC